MTEDRLLVDVAIRVQLSPRNFTKAVGRYEIISQWIERDSSELKDRVLSYPQGSMAIGATIASKLRTDEFDVDFVAQLELPLNTEPSYPLDLLYAVIRGQPDSRYYWNTRRRTRCVTVKYADKMHIDITPVIRRLSTPERESYLFHHDPEEPQRSAVRLIANPYGFAEWFKSNTPVERGFAMYFEQQADTYERSQFYADSEPVPAQTPTTQKSKAVIALQLLKRWRNVQYDARPGRRPPSVMIAKLVADLATRTECRLSEELYCQALAMRDEFMKCHSAGVLIHVCNPCCPGDVLTDRWPGTLDEQEVFLRDLMQLVDKLQQLKLGCDLGKMRQIMIELFGEDPVSGIFDDFNQQIGGSTVNGQSLHNPQIGGLVIPAAGASPGQISPVRRSTRSHTFHGDNK